MCVGGSGIGGGRGAEGGSNVLFFARCFASTVVWCHFFFPIHFCFLGFCTLKPSTSQPWPQPLQSLHVAKQNVH